MCPPLAIFSTSKHSRPSLADRCELLTGGHTEFVESENEDWLVDLESEDLWLNKRQRLAVDLDQALTLLAVCDSGCCLLLAEALNALNSCHDCDLQAESSKA